MLVTQTKNSTNDLVFKLTLPTGLNWNDIQEAIFIVKADIDDSINDAVFSKSTSNGSVELSLPDLIIVHFEDTDYGNVIEEYNYIGAILCRFTGQTDFDERIDTFDFQIKKAMHND